MTTRRYLETCFAKVRRAEEQLAKLEVEFRGSPGNEAYRTFIQHDSKKRHYRIEARIKPERWMEWSVIIGEIAHDLRSALDQSVCLAVRNNLPDDSCDGLGFPIRSSAPLTNKDRETYEHTIRDVPDKPRAVIDRKQPHTAPKDPQLQDLLDLHRLNKWDKHRSLPLLVTAFWGEWDAGTPDQPVPGVGFWHAHDPSLDTMEARVPLKDGTDLYVWEFELPANVGDNANVAPVVCLDESGPIKRPLIGAALRSMCSSVRATLDEMEASVWVAPRP